MGEAGVYLKAVTTNKTVDGYGVTWAYFCLPTCHYLRQINFDGNMTCNGIPTNMTENRQFGGITVYVVVECWQADPYIIYKTE